MSDRAVLHYFNGRGKMESIRWLLTVVEAEVNDRALSLTYFFIARADLIFVATFPQFDEMYLTSRDQYEKLLNG